MIDKDKKYKLARDTFFAAVNTPIKPSVSSLTGEIEVGKTGMMLFNMPQGGALFFNEEDVVEVG